MIRKILVLFLVFIISSCAELQQVVNQLPQGGGGIGNTEIASGLRQALDFGIDKQVTKLTQTDGFFKNELVKILLPEELHKVDKALRDIGLSLGLRYNAGLSNIFVDNSRIKNGVFQISAAYTFEL